MQFLQILIHALGIKCTYFAQIFEAYLSFLYQIQRLKFLTKLCCLKPFLGPYSDLYSAKFIALYDVLKNQNFLCLIFCIFITFARSLRQVFEEYKVYAQYISYFVLLKDYALRKTKFVEENLVTRKQISNIVLVSLINFVKFLFLLCNTQHSQDIVMFMVLLYKMTLKVQKVCYKQDEQNTYCNFQIRSQQTRTYTHFWTEMHKMRIQKVCMSNA